MTRGPIYQAVRQRVLCFHIPAYCSTHSPRHHLPRPPSIVVCNVSHKPIYIQRSHSLVASALRLTREKVHAVPFPSVPVSTSSKVIIELASVALGVAIAGRRPYRVAQIECPDRRRGGLLVYAACVTNLRIHACLSFG
jgi:hypothetical protein